LLFAPKYTLIHFINITFYIFSIFLIVFLFLHIKKGVLFDGLSFVMNRFRIMMSKNMVVIDSFKHKKKTSQYVNIIFFFFFLLYFNIFIIIKFVYLIVYLLELIDFEV